MPSQGKAYTAEQKEFIVRLKHAYDEERATQSSVSTRNPAARVAKGLQVGLSTVKTVFGDHAEMLKVSSTKSMTGHLLGGAGGLEAGITALALREQMVPPTMNYETPDPDCDLDYVPNEARKLEFECALSNSFGFGGTNAALLFRRYSTDS